MIVSDVLITKFSSTGFESMLFEKPVIIIGFMKEDMDGLYIKENLALSVKDPSKLKGILEKIILDEEYQKEIILEQEKNLSRFIFSNDGKSGKRVVDFLNSQLN